jgi:hypothetical protein
LLVSITRRDQRFAALARDGFRVFAGARRRLALLLSEVRLGIWSS